MKRGYPALWIFTLVTLLITCVQLPAQNRGTDEPQQIIERLRQHPEEDTLQVLRYDSIAFRFYMSDPQQGAEYGKQGIALAEKIGYRRGLTLCLISTGVCYWASADYPHALEYLLRGLKNAEQEKDKAGIAKASGNLGNVYAEQEDYGKAMTYYQLALQICREQKDTLGMARKLGNIGTVYKEMRNPAEALRYFKDALFNYTASGNTKGSAITLANIGWAYTDQGMYREALDSYNKALAMAGEHGEQRWRMYSYGTIGELYYRMATDDTSGNYRKIYAALSLSQKAYYLDQSLAYSTQAAEIAREIRAGKSLIGWLQMQANACLQLARYRDAYDFMQQSHEIKDSLFSEETKVKIANLDARRETELKEKELQLQATRLEKVSIQRIALIGGVAGLIIIVVVIYASHRRSERLLHNMLPAKIARRLKKRERPIAEKFSDTAVVFTDIVGFTEFSKDKKPEFIVEMLNEFFRMMDHLSEKNQMEKIKTIGDRYLAVCGLPEPNEKSLECAARFALDVREMMQNFTTSQGQAIHVRIGMDAGPVVAGVIGEKKYSYDLWGDTVNTASRMESSGMEGEIQVTETVRRKLADQFAFTYRGELEVKGKGVMKTWILSGIPETSR